MNKICELFKIKYPIIQAGMVWTSGWRLAAAVSNSGGLGLIGAGRITGHHIRAIKKNNNLKILAICDLDILTSFVC